MVVERRRYGIKSSMMQSSYLSEARGNLGMQNGLREVVLYTSTENCSG